MGKPKNYDDLDEQLFDVAVWTHDGDVIKSLWSVTWQEVEDVREQYEDEPLLTVVVTDRP